MNTKLTMAVYEMAKLKFTLALLLLLCGHDSGCSVAQLSSRRIFSSSSAACSTFFLVRSASLAPLLPSKSSSRELLLCSARAAVEEKDSEGKHIGKG